MQEANRDLYKKQKAAEAMLYEQEKTADARRTAAEAAFFARQKEAEAELYAKKREAEGLIALGNAQSQYLSSLLGALGGNYHALRDYLMINKGMYQEIARINADGIKGLSPKISVWNTNGDGGEGGAMNEVSEFYRKVPPLMNIVQDQTGIQPVQWLGGLSNGRIVPNAIADSEGRTKAGHSLSPVSDRNVIAKVSEE